MNIWKQFIETKRIINDALCLQSLHQLSDITFPILNPSRWSALESNLSQELAYDVRLVQDFPYDFLIWNIAEKQLISYVRNHLVAGRDCYAATEVFYSLWQATSI
jgi:hypothetical protein